MNIRPLLVANYRSAPIRELAKMTGLRLTGPRARRRKSAISSILARARVGGFVINWGIGNYHKKFHDALKYVVSNGGNVLNPPAATVTAINKMSALSACSENRVPVVPFTRSKAEASVWLMNGRTVMERHVVKGSMGEGIVVRAPEDGPLGQSLLYTQYLPKCREYRVHVGDKQVLLVSQKKRRSGFSDSPDSNTYVRNLQGGWVFCVNEVTEDPRVLPVAIAAVSALGLNFAAVDVLANKNGAYFLEANTAPGLLGQSTRVAYFKYLENILATI